MNIDHGKRFSRGKVYINGIEGFWSFAKERLIKHTALALGKSYTTSKKWNGGIITGREIYLN